jgi:DHA1 family tetracycline resistance protein-like MFS transporter
MTAEPRRAAIAFVFVTVLLDVLALGMIIPVLPGLVTQLVGGDLGDAAHVVGVFGTVWAFMQFVASPVLGSLSDRWGRRPIILVSNFGLGADYVLMALAPTLPWLLVGRIISGVTAASISTAYAYIADVTPPEKRAGSFGLLGAAFGLGFVCGPAVGGLLGGVDPRLPFWVAAALSFANGAYGLFVLPESLPPEKRAQFSWNRASPIGALGLLRARPAVLGLAMVTFLGFLAHEVLPATFVLYADHRYDWGPREVGFTLGVVGVCGAIVQGALARPIVALTGERRALVLGLLAGAVGFAVYGLAPTGLVFFVGIPVMSLWGLATPAAQALMSSRMAANEQGQLQGALASLRGISGMIGPGLFTTAFALAIADDAPAHVPGASFLLAAALLATAMISAAWVTRS